MEDDLYDEEYSNAPTTSHNSDTTPLPPEIQKMLDRDRNQTIVITAILVAGMIIAGLIYNKRRPVRPITPQKDKTENTENNNNININRPKTYLLNNLYQKYR